MPNLLCGFLLGAAISGGLLVARAWWRRRRIIAIIVTAPRAALDRPDVLEVWRRACEEIDNAALS